MTSQQLTIWQAIDALTKQIPFSKSKVEATLLMSPLIEKNTSDEIYKYYKSSPVTLKDEIIISNVDLRVQLSTGHLGFLVLNIGDTCISLAEVHQHYPKLEITDTPRGRSLDDVTSHTAKLPWGELSFSFAERNPNCVSSIAFKPKKSN